METSWFASAVNGLKNLNMTIKKKLYLSLYKLGGQAWATDGDFESLTSR